jgi:DNA-binding transcriptional LysR family regulator
VPWACSFSHASGDGCCSRKRARISCGLVGGCSPLRERARSLRAGDTGVLAIGATPPMIESVLAGFLPGHRARHPGIDIRIVEEGGASLVSRLERGEVQVAYIPVGDERFAGRLLYPVHVVALVAEGHDFARRGVLDIVELSGQPLLALRRGFGSREWFDAACEAADVRPTVLLESSSHNAVLQLAASGYGIGILPSAVTLPKKGLRAIPLVHRRASIGKWTMLGSSPLHSALCRKVRRRACGARAEALSRAGLPGEDPADSPAGAARPLAFHRPWTARLSSGACSRSSMP